MLDGMHFHFFGGAMRIEKISAVTLKVASMLDSVRFYGNVWAWRLFSEGKRRFSLRFAPSTAAPLSLI